MKRRYTLAFLLLCTLPVLCPGTAGRNTRWCEPVFGFAPSDGCTESAVRPRLFASVPYRLGIGGTRRARLDVPAGGGRHVGPVVAVGAAAQYRARKRRERVGAQRGEHPRVVQLPQGPCGRSGTLSLPRVSVGRGRVGQHPLDLSGGSADGSGTRSRRRLRGRRHDVELRPARRTSDRRGEEDRTALCAQRHRPRTFVRLQGLGLRASYAFRRRAADARRGQRSACRTGCAGRVDAVARGARPRRAARRPQAPPICAGGSSRPTNCVWTRWGASRPASRGATCRT